MFKVHGTLHCYNKPIFASPVRCLGRDSFHSPTVRSCLPIVRDGRCFLGRGRTVEAIGMPTSSSELLAQTSQRGSANTCQQSSPSACMEGAFCANIPPRDVGGAQVDVVPCTLYLTPLFSAEAKFTPKAHHGRQARSHRPTPNLAFCPCPSSLSLFPFLQISVSLSLSLYLIFSHTWTHTDVPTVSRSCLCFLEYGYRTSGERNVVKTFRRLRWASPGYFLGFLFCRYLFPMRPGRGEIVDLVS